MGSAAVMEKLFALERAVGKVSGATLRAMILDVQEAVLAMDREQLTHAHADEACLREITNESLARELAKRAGSGGEPGPAIEVDPFPLGISPTQKKSA